ncbi:hypothetical protein [Leptolyngbya sp. FACHB-711]|jgi:hypothetical protein|uniref:hypothetical protein n=1 Tax=unclassified Leptolyngbya TaxID=2650499 RepID=UPI0016882461|nr:hypothetical protein [Leptolyngbya sp. FACHB-711]MBD1853034.1 hypothetical protein [Cyanobacteria bacterium FACHB-502]MBD2024623.1 hypothetical protein [Leptolyngbya sp. FACHB-711]
MSRHFQVEAAKRTPHYWIVLPTQIPSACRVCIVELAWAAFTLHQHQAESSPTLLSQHLIAQGSPL